MYLFPGIGQFNGQSGGKIIAPQGFTKFGTITDNLSMVYSLPPAL
jgi:hypothetical protein